MVAGAVGLAESPFAFEGLLVALDLAVDLGAADWDQQMPDAVSLEQLAERAVLAVDEGVIAHQPLDGDPVRGVENEPAFDEAGDRCRTLVGVELAVGEPRVVVDEGVHKLMADPRALLGAGAKAIAGDGVPGTSEASETLAVDVEQIAWAGPFVAARLLPRLPGRPPDGRMRVPRLAGDQPRTPAAASSGRADPRLLCRRQQPRAAVGPRGA